MKKMFTLIFIIFLINSGNVSDKYLHKNAVIYEFDSTISWEIQPITAGEAADYAVKELNKSKVKNIEICTIRWIASPLGGYLVDSKGKLKIKDKVYTHFRIGIRDGSEEKSGNYKKGEIFAFIAKGKDKKMNIVWIPECGPECFNKKAVEEDCFMYEFYNLDKSGFENIYINYK